MKTQKTIVSVNNYCMLFFVAAFTGFLWEILIYLVQEQQFYKRGFFHGPWLPIYGTGAVIIYFYLRAQKSHPLRCFFFSGLLGGTVELLLGWFLYTFFHAKYWDYTGQLLHLNGYICLYSLLGFALAGMLLVCFVAPWLFSLWQRLPLHFRINLISVLLILLAIDTAVSLIIPNKGTGVTF